MLYGQLQKLQIYGQVKIAMFGKHGLCLGQRVLVSATELCIS